MLPNPKLATLKIGPAPACVVMITDWSKNKKIKKMQCYCTHNRKSIFAGGTRMIQDLIMFTMFERWALQIVKSFG